jgi:hypothetical protein
MVGKGQSLPSTVGLERSTHRGGVHASLSRGAFPILGFHRIKTLAILMFTKRPPVANPPDGAGTQRGNQPSDLEPTLSTQRFRELQTATPQLAFSL